MNKDFAIREQFILALTQYGQKDVIAAFENGDLKIEDAIFYATKSLESNSAIELIRTSDRKEHGVTNLDNGKMEAARYFLLYGIRLQTATLAAAPTHDTIVAADFSNAIESTVACGELNIDIAGKVIVPSISGQIFQSVAQENGLKNYFELKAPKLITPQSPIGAWFYLGKSATPNTIIRIELHGVMLV